MGQGTSRECNPKTAPSRRRQLIDPPIFHARSKPALTAVTPRSPLPDRPDACDRRGRRRKSVRSRPDVTRCPSTYGIALRRLGGTSLQIQAFPQFIDPTIDAKAENGSIEMLPQKRKGKGPADEPRDCALKIIIPGVNFRRGRADNRVPLKNQWE